jgi:hypothetical protein
MKLRLTFLCIAVVLGVIAVYRVTAQAQQRTQERASGVTGLTKDDFTITEDNKPQRIFSFEAPEAHVMSGKEQDENPNGKAPAIRAWESTG